MTETPQAFGKYQVIRPLGKGGMATVYLARDPNGAQVAIKVPHSNYANDPEFRRRLDAEKDALCRLNHPCIAVFKDFHEDWNPPILAMEFVDGSSLEQHLSEDHQPWSTIRACNILTQIAEALAYCHKAGIIHRDVKPANILLTGADHVKVTDFGISRLKDVPSQTHVGTIVGSALVMAPEQWRSEKLTAKVDIYALGVIAYRLLTGRYPFEGGIAQLSNAHCHQHPPPPRALNPDLAPPLAELIHACLNKEPRLRLSSADEFISRLKRLRPQLEIYERYRFEDEIGRGSMGVVYRATRRSDGMKVAIKTLDQKLTDETLLRRLNAEAAILARLNHRFICKMIETQESFLVMEYVSGEPLSDYIRRVDGLAPDEALIYFKDILEAVGAAHRESVIHRDLKPSNVIVTDDPIARHAIVMDFGIAKLLGSSGMTRTAEGVGAVPYKAPELWERKPPNPQSDVYALGAMLYEMLTCRYPFPGPELEDFRDQHMKRPPDPLPPEIGYAHPELATLVMRCLEKDPSKRFASVDELYAAIPGTAARVATPPRTSYEAAPTTYIDAASQPGPEPPSRAKGRRLVWGGAGVLLAIAAIFVIWQWLQGGDSQPVSRLGDRQPGAQSETKQDSTNEPTVAVDPGTSDMESGTSDDGSSSLETATPESAPTGEQSPGDGAASATSADRGVAVPTLPVLRVSPAPDRDTRCIIDGYDYGSEREFRIAEGPHRLKLIHPDYPIFETTVHLSPGDTAVHYDLAAQFANRKSIDLRVALNPPSQAYSLSVVLNGRSRSFTKFPVRGLSVRAGEWEFAAQLKTLVSYAEKARVDSCVTFPYGGGPRILVKGDSADLDFSSPEWTDAPAIPIHVYWSNY
jgi:serine/threonine protein kinase